MGVFGGYASRHGHALLDRELSLRAEWTNDPTRCQQARIPADRLRCPGLVTVAPLASKPRDV